MSIVLLFALLSVAIVFITIVVCYNVFNKSKSVLSIRCLSTDFWLDQIIAICILLLFFGVFDFVYSQWIDTPKPVAIEITITPQDSLATAYAYDAHAIDSLIQKVNESMTSYQNTYRSIEEKADDDRFKSLASMLIGLISSIALFFGYKSFRDIRERGEEMSKSVAKDEANQVAKVAAEAYLNDKMPQLVDNALTKGAYEANALKTLKDEITKERDIAIEQKYNNLKEYIDSKCPSTTPETSTETEEPATEVQPMSETDMFDAPATPKTESETAEKPEDNTQNESKDGKN